MSGDRKIAGVFWAACGAAALAGALSLAMLAVLTFGGCSAAPFGTGAQRFRIPWQVTPGDYRLQTIAIRTFDRPESFSGRWAQIIVGPYVINGQLSGGSPIGRFIRDREGVLRPADLATRQATTIYAHFENLRFMEEKFGIAESAPWPAKIGLRTRMREEKGDALDNALYDGPLDAVLMVPYSQPGLPIAYNAGILAHERFHAAFYAMVLKPLAAASLRPPAARPWDEWEDDDGAADFADGRAPAAVTLAAAGGAAGARPQADASSEDEPNDLLLRAINEGLADVWGWAYSGDEAFVGRSLAKAGEARKLDGRLRGVATREEWQDRLAVIRARSSHASQRRKDQVAQAYALGTEYARLFKRLAAEQAGADPEAARREAAKAIARALPVILEAVRADYKARAPLDPRSPAREYAKALIAEGKASVAACRTAKEFFEPPESCRALGLSGQGGRADEDER